MVDVIAKATNKLNPTDILFQTPYWAQVKSQMGMAPWPLTFFLPKHGAMCWCS